VLSAYGAALGASSPGGAPQRGSYSVSWAVVEAHHTDWSTQHGGGYVVGTTQDSATSTSSP